MTVYMLFVHIYSNVYLSELMEKAVDLDSVDFDVNSAII